MGLAKSLRTLLALCIPLPLLSVASAQVVGPNNGNFSGNSPQFSLQTTQVTRSSPIRIYPLTNDAGLAGSQEQLNVRRAS